MADELDQLRLENEELRKAADRYRAERDHTTDWYAVRLRKIEDIAKREKIWNEVAAVIANGSGTRQLPDGSFAYDPPTYAQLLNGTRFRAERLEKEIVKLKAEGERLCLCGQNFLKDIVKERREAAKWFDLFQQMRAEMQRMKRMPISDAAKDGSIILAWEKDGDPWPIALRWKNYTLERHGIERDDEGNTGWWEPCEELLADTMVFIEPEFYIPLSALCDDPS